MSELNQLEVEFLTLNNFALAISIEELQTYGDQLMKHWMCEEVANKDPEDERPSPSVPAALSAPPVQGAHENAHSENNGDATYDGKGRSDQEPRQGSSRPPQNYQQRDSGRKETEHRSGPPRQDYRQHHTTDPRHEQHRREHRQEQLRDYKQDPPQHQYASHSQQQQHLHKNGSSRQYKQGPDSSYGLDGGRFSSQQAPITPTEMTHATSRLAAPSPIH